MNSKLVGPLLLLMALSVSADSIISEQLSSLNQPVSNNAVTLVSTGEGVYVYSFLGLGKGKTWQDISSGATVLGPNAESWRKLADVPGDAGRLAASAVTVGMSAWVFGGYTVSEDGSEESTPGVYKLSPGTSNLDRVSDMPVPVEDSVALVHQDRYVYLVSGWHDLGMSISSRCLIRRPCNGHRPHPGRASRYSVIPAESMKARCYFAME